MAKPQVKGGEKFAAYLQRYSAKLKKGVVRSGFFPKATYDDGTPVAAVAAFNDFGTRKIPPRPFFRNMVAEHKAGWPKILAVQLKVTGGDSHKALERVGEVMDGQLRESIQKTNSPPLSPLTIKAKGSAKPLIASGRMFNSVNHEVDD